MQVFLSYSSGDKERVRQLYHRLLAKKFDPWMDEQKLRGGQDWQLEIGRAIRRSGVVVICLSRDAVTKEGYVQREVREALDVAAEKPEGMIFIIPLRLEECEVPDSLSKYHRIDYFRQDGFEKLRESLTARQTEIKSRSVSLLSRPERTESVASYPQSTPQKSSTRTDDLIRRAKDHPVLSWLIAVVLALAFVLGLIVDADNVRKVFWPAPDKPAGPSPSASQPPTPSPEPDSSDPGSVRVAPTEPPKPRSTRPASPTADSRAKTPNGEASPPPKEDRVSGDEARDDHPIIFVNNAQVKVDDSRRAIDMVIPLVNRGNVETQGTIMFRFINADGSEIPTSRFPLKELSR